MVPESIYQMFRIKQHTCVQLPPADLLGLDSKMTYLSLPHETDRLQTGHVCWKRVFKCAGDDCDQVDHEQ